MSRIAMSGYPAEKDGGTSPSVSVIIPVWNGERLLPRALASLIAQTERNFEIIVVDDGSTDGTAACIDAAAAADARVRSIRLKRNIGAPAASNQGIAAARGEWIAILDHDDWYHPSRLEHLLAFARAGDFDIVADNQHHWDERGGVVFRIAIPLGFGGKKLDLHEFLHNAQTGRLLFDYGMLKPVLRREFIRGSGLRYLEDCPEGYDFHFLLDAFGRGASVGLLDEPLYYYTAPYGEISRDFSRPDKLRRKLAHYNTMRRRTEQAAEAYVAVFRAADIRLLRERAQSIRAYSAYLEARAGMGEGRALTALGGLVLTPAAWPFALRAAVRHLPPLATFRPIAPVRRAR